MTVAAQTPTISYTENGSTTAFAVPFRYDSPSDLKAVRRAADGTETVLVNGTDFTASPGPTNAGGTLTVTAAAASGVKLTIFRDTARTQPADYINNGAFTADSHERALDKAMLVSQEQDVSLARAVKAPVGETGLTLPPLAELEGKVIGVVGGRGVPVPASAVQAQDAANRAAASAAAAAISRTGAETARTGAQTARTGAEQARDAAVAAADIAANLGNAPLYNALADLPTANGTRGWAIVLFGANEGIYQDVAGSPAAWVRRGDTEAVRAKAEADRASDEADRAEAAADLAANPPALQTGWTEDVGEGKIVGNPVYVPGPAIPLSGAPTLAQLQAIANRLSLVETALGNDTRRMKAVTDILFQAGFVAGVAPSILEPAAAWNGTAGSGFAAVPTDPTRTTAKPACRLLVPPFQYFTDTLDVGVIAMANDGGTLYTNFGIASVKFMFEGGEAVVATPGWQTIETQRGARTYFGWWTRIKKPEGKAGQANLYIEATARDATMQKRVIGPFLFSPADQQYTHSVTVAPSQPVEPGVSYQTLNAAATYVNQLGSANPLITIAEPGLYELTVGGGTPGILLRTGLPGRLNITASVPNVRIGRANYTTDAAATINDVRYKLRFFGPNLSLDYRYVLNVNGSSNDSGQGAWLDGVNMISTAPLGASELWRGTIKPNGLGSVRGAAWFTECVVTDLTNFGNTANLIRGCDLDRVAGDIFSNSSCCINNRVRVHSGRPQSDPLDAFTIQYTGPASSATLTRTGGQGSFNGGVWIVDIGGTEYSFDTRSIDGNEAGFNGLAGDGYWFSDLVTWLNTIPDITAVLLLDENDPLEKRVAASGTLPGLASGGFTDRDIKTAPLTVISFFNKHSDFYQHTAGVLENVIIAYNKADAVEAQGLFFAPSGIAGGMQGAEIDFFAVGNAIGISTDVTPTFDPSGGYSQFGRGSPSGMRASHVVIAHNTLPNQGFWIRTNGIPFGSTADSYCILKNNVFRTLFYDANGPLPNLTIDGLRIHSGFPKPAASTNVQVGGNQNTLFVDFAAKDFRPAGQLASNGFAAAIPFDMNRTPFPEFSALGAYALAAPQYLPPPPSLDPLGDLTTMFEASSPHSGIYRLRNGTLAGGVMTFADMTANNNDFTQATGSVQPTIEATGATFETSDWIGRPLGGGTYSVIMRLSKADASTSGNILSDQGATALLSYLQGGTGSTTISTVLIGDQGIANRDALYQALHQTGFQVIEVQGVNHVGDTLARIGRGSATTAQMTVDWVIYIREDDFPDALSEVRSLAKQIANLP